MKIHAWLAAAVVSAAVLSAPARAEDLPPGAPTWLGLLAQAADGPATRPAAEGKSHRLHPPYTTIFPAYVDEGLARWLDSDYFTQKHFQVDYAATLHCDRPVSGQSADMAITQHDFGVRWLPFEDYVYTPTFNMRVLDIRTDARLPHTGEPFPEHLWDVRVSQTFFLPPAFGAVDVTMGSASDRPFDSADEVTADITWFCGYPFASRGGVSPIFLVNYANNRDFLNRRVYPGVGLRMQPTENLRYMVGFPFNAVHWRFLDRFTLSADYQFPRTVHSRLAWRAARPVELFAGFDWTNRRFFRHDRRTRDDRLWYLEKRVYGGLKWDFTKAGYFEVLGGYAFDRFFFEGDRYEDRSFNRINIADGPFLMLQIGLRF